MEPLSFLPRSYFDEDEGVNDQYYQPAPGSPSAEQHSSRYDNNSDDEDDPLEAYMSGIEVGTCTCLLLPALFKLALNVRIELFILSCAGGSVQVEGLRRWCEGTG